MFSRANCLQNSSSWPSFVTTGSADILNRLTHDLGIIDAELPELLLDLVCGEFARARVGH